MVDASSLGAFRPAIGVVFALVRYGVRPSAASRERFLRQILAGVDLPVSDRRAFRGELRYQFLRGGTSVAALAGISF